MRWTVVAWAVATVGLGCVVTSEVLTWVDLTTEGDPATLEGLAGTPPRLPQLATWHAPAYYLGLVALLALTTVTLLSGAAARRAVAAAAVGCAVAEAVLLVGVLTRILEGSGLESFGADSTVDFGVGKGFYSAIAGVTLVAAGAALRAWPRAARLS